MQNFRSSKDFPKMPSLIMHGNNFDSADLRVDDLIMWPPVVIIHNTVTGKSKDGPMEGLGNKAMDSNIRGWCQVK